MCGCVGRELGFGRGEVCHVWVRGGFSGRGQDGVGVPSVAILSLSLSFTIALSWSGGKPGVDVGRHCHLGFYPPQTPYTRPRCAQVAISAQTREPACGSLFRDPPLPTIQERGRSAVFLWCSAASTCPGFPHWSKQTETTATTRFSILWYENEVHHPRVFPKSLQHRTVAHTLGSASAVG